MAKAIKKILKISLIILVIAIPLLPYMYACAFLLSGSCGNVKSQEHARPRLENLGVDVPDEAEIVYHLYASGFQDWEQYTYFQFKEHPTEWLNENGFSEEKSMDFEEEFESFQKSIVDKVPKKYIADFSSDYLWLQVEDFMFCDLVYFPDKMLLITYIIKF